MKPLLVSLLIPLALVASHVRAEQFRILAWNVESNRPGPEPVSDPSVISEVDLTARLTRPPPTSCREYTPARSADRHLPDAHRRKPSILSPAVTATGETGESHLVDTEPFEMAYTFCVDSAGRCFDPPEDLGEENDDPDLDGDPDPDPSLN